MTSRVISLLVGSFFGAIVLLAQPPSITAVENNYSYTLPGVPNYGIAPGSIFVIFGSNLSTVTVPVLQSSAAPGVPLTLNGVSVSVAVGGRTAPVPLYYVSATQIAGILPATVPVGTGTITVKNNDQVSAPAPIKVVASAFGILTANNAGYATVAGYDATNKFLTPTNSTSAGQTIVLYGTGLGADPANDDRIFPQKQNNLTNIPVQVFVGGIAGNITYRGRSQFPGLDQINITIPQGVPTGCYVSSIVMIGKIVSNSTTVPIAPNAGGTCSDPNTEFTPAQLQAVRNKSTINVGTIFLDQENDLVKNTLRGELRGRFLSYTAGQFSIEPPFHGFISYGSCQTFSAGANPAHLNAGSSIGASGPGGAVTAMLNTLKNGSVGDYRTPLPTGFIPADGGTFTFSGTGSTSVGAFSNASVALPSPVIWTNMSALPNINRSQGVTVTWGGGSPGEFVVIQGSAVVPAPTNHKVEFYCAAPVSAGTFTVPPSILLALPPVTGDLGVTSVTIPSRFSAPGLDLGAVFAQVGTKVPVTYQ